MEGNDLDCQRSQYSFDMWSRYKIKFKSLYFCTDILVKLAPQIIHFSTSQITTSLHLLCIKNLKKKISDGIHIELTEKCLHIRTLFPKA